MAAMRVAVIVSWLVALAHGGRRELVVCIKHPNLLERDYQALEFVDKMRLTQRTVQQSENMTYNAVQNYIKKLSKNMQSLEDMSSFTILGNYLPGMFRTMKDSQKIFLRENKKLKEEINEIHRNGIKVTKQLQKLLTKLKNSRGYKKLTAGQRKMLNLIFIPAGGIQLMNAIRPDIVSLGGVAQYFQGLQKKLHITDDRRVNLAIVTHRTAPFGEDEDVPHTWPQWRNYNVWGRANSIDVAPSSI